MCSTVCTWIERGKAWQYWIVVSNLTWILYLIKNKRHNLISSLKNIAFQKVLSYSLMELDFSSMGNQSPPFLTKLTILLQEEP